MRNPQKKTFFITKKNKKEYSKLNTEKDDKKYPEFQNENLLDIIRGKIDSNKFQAFS